MDKYSVKLYTRAARDLEEIYDYISAHLLEPKTAINMVDLLEKAILSLEELPERGALRKTGAFADGKHRQLFVKNYIILYVVLKDKKEVRIKTIRYSKSQF